MSDSEEILADRLNTEPPIFRELSNSELGMVFTFGAIFWVPVCLLIDTLLGKPLRRMDSSILMPLPNNHNSGHC